MIKVFSGKWRGLGESQDGLGMLIDFKFRGILCKFSGAKLAVFMCIALHSDQAGLSFPSINTISRETGYATSTVSQALNDLCKLRIDGYRVLGRTSRTKKDGSNTSNLYMIFPSENELSENGFSPISETGIPPIPKIGVPPIPETDIPPIPDSDIPPIPEIGNEDIPLNLKENHSSLSLATAPKKSDPPEQEIQKATTREKGDQLDGTLACSRNPDELDVSAYPKELRPILKEFCRLWGLTPPRQSGKGGQYALWIIQGRSLEDALAEFGANALPAVYESWCNFKYDVVRPGAIVTAARATAGRLRSEAREAASVNKGIDPEEAERQREQLRKQKEMRANGQSDGSIENWLARAEARHHLPAVA